MHVEAIKVVFGGGRIGNKEPFTPGTGLAAALQTLTNHGVTTIDSAQAYNNSQATIGEVNAGNEFIIDTKWSGRRATAGPGGPNASGQARVGPPQGGLGGWAKKEYIIESAKDSIKKLNVKQVWSLSSKRIFICFAFLL